MPAEGADAHERGFQASLVPHDDARPTRDTRVGGRGVRRKAKARRPEGRGKLSVFLEVLADRLIDVAPRIPVRDLATLRAQFPDQGPEEIADHLVSAATKGSATVGAGVGAAAMMPVPPAMPAELAAEITGVAAVEIKLIAELHELYGQRPPGGTRQRAAAYLTSWTQERGIDPLVPATVRVSLGAGFRRELRQNLLKRAFRNLPNLTPLMIGAVVGALMNRRDTRRLASRVREDLRRGQTSWSASKDAAKKPPPAQPT